MVYVKDVASVDRSVASWNEDHSPPAYLSWYVAPVATPDTLTVRTSPVDISANRLLAIVTPPSVITVFDPVLRVWAVFDDLKSAAMVTSSVTVNEVDALSVARASGLVHESNS